MEKKLGIDIIIPAYNEEVCLPDLLEDLSRINTNKFFQIGNIVVISDASTDKTNSIVNKYQISNPKLTIVIKKLRTGKFDSINFILKRSEADGLILLDADIRLESENTILQMVETIRLSGADLVGTNVIPLKPKHRGSPSQMARYFDWILEDKMRTIKPTSYWSAYGRALGLSKRFYKSLRLPTDQADDLFIYFSCISNNFRFIYAHNAKIFFEGPKSITDYIRQFSRFFFYVKKSKQYFGKDLIDNDLKVPGMLFFTISSFLKFPTFGYFWVLCRFLSIFAYHSNHDLALLDRGIYKTASGRVLPNKEY